MMNKLNTSEKRLRAWLGILQVFVGIGAVPAGISMVTNPSGSGLGMTVEMLVDSPFTDFMIPGFFLLGINGIGSLFGAVASFLRHRFVGKMAIGLGIFLILWIAVQAYWLGLHWLHIVYFGLGMTELTLGLKVEKKLH